MGAKKEYTTRKLTAEEREFASRPENHNLIFKFMRINRLDPEEFYDILSLDYLTAVKIYITEKPELQLKYEFPAVAFQKMKGAMQHYYRATNRKKRMPEGGFVSLDYMLKGDNPFSEYAAHEDWWIDKKLSVERQVILMELFKEFYQECVTNDNEINTRLRYTLDLLLNGYTKKEVYEAVEEYMDYFYNKKTLENDIKDFRRIFKSVFGI